MSEGVSGEGSGWRRTHPLGILAGGVLGLKSAALPLIALLFSSRGQDWAPLAGLMGLAAACLIAFGSAWLGWRVRRYRVGADDIRLERGFIGRTARAVPYERIQDVSLEEALVPRLLGLVEVRFETGAGGKDELKLAYVDRGEGERLRETVRSRKDGAGPLAPAEAEEPPARILFAMTPRRLLVFGLFEFSLIIFAVLGGAAQQFDFLLPFDLWDPDNWGGLVAGQERWLLGLGVASQLAGAVFALAALGLVGLATGLGRTVLRDWGFRLEDTPKGLRRRRGLLTRTDVVMPLHRVQALTVSTGIIRRLFGWHALGIVSLAQDAGSASHVAVPFGKMEEIAPVVAVTGFALPTHRTDWRRPSARYRIDGALLGGLPFVFIAWIVSLAAASMPDMRALTPLSAGLLLLGALLALRQLFLWRYDRHALDARHIHVRHGWLSPRLTIASRVKLHSVEIAQGPLAQRRGYATLRLGLAGGTLEIGGVPLADARDMRSAILDSIATVDFSQMAAPEDEERPRHAMREPGPVSSLSAGDQ